jgi:O-antigen ligase
LAGDTKINHTIENENMTTDAFQTQPLSARWIQLLCAALGFVTFWPVGMTYLFMMLLIISMLLQRSQWSARWQGLRSRWIVGILAFAVIWPLLTLLWHPLFNDTGTRLFHLVRVSLILLAGLLLLERERDWAIKGFVIGALVAATIISVHYIRPLPEWDPWKHLLLEKSHNASQKMVAMASAAGLLIALLGCRSLSVSWKMVCLAGFVWMCAVVFLHGTSRNAHLVFISMPVALLIYHLRNWKIWTLVGLVLVVMLFISAQVKPQVWLQTTASMERLSRISDIETIETSTMLRMKQWSTAVEQLQKHPIEGTGLGSWQSIWSKTPLVSPESNARGLNNPHNDYLLNAAETGVLGLLSVLAIVVWFAWRSWRMNSLWGAAAFCLTSAVAVTAFVNAPFRDGGFGMSLMWLMAAATAGSYASLKRSSA